VERDGRRTDQIVLACTHFPLIVDRINRLSPWAVGFVDPAPAIARRVDALIGSPRVSSSISSEGMAIFTSGDPPQPALQKTLRLYGLAFTSAATIGSATA
jgi:glutamate racemase